MHTRKVLITSIIIGMIIIFIAYAGVEFRSLFLGPKINLYSPLNGTTVNNPIIQTEGVSERTKALTINGNRTLIDTNGRFSVNLVLSPGYNIITIVATDSRGKSETLTRKIYYETLDTSSESNEDADTSTSTTETSATGTATTSNTTN